MVDLPYEIWMYIASLLPDDVLSRVEFSMNRAFLHHALDREYRAVHFGDFANPQAFHRFLRLQDHSLAARVRTLTFRNTVLPVHENSSTPPPLPPTRKISWRRRRFWRARSRVERSTAQITEPGFLELISGMVNVTSFTLESYQVLSQDATLLHCSQPLFHTAVHYFSSSLQALQLSVFGDRLPWTLPTKRLIPNLRRVSLVFAEYTSLPGEPFLDSVAPFLNAHREHLQSLTLGMYTCASSNLRVIMESLESFPKLESLSIAQTLPFDFDHADMAGKYSATALHDFVIQRAPKLVHLDLYSWPSIVSKFLSRPLRNSNGNRPQIRNLKLDIAKGMLDNTPSPSLFGTFICPIAKSLVVLEISHLVFELPEFKLLLGAFQNSPSNADSQGGENCPLRRLAVEVAHLEPELFIYTSTVLPGLLTFEVGYCWLRGPISISTLVNPGSIGGYHFCSVFRIPSIQFCESMRTSCYFDDWNLEHLRIKPLRNHPWESCKEAIARSFPRVKTFNGASKDEYLSWSNMNKI